MFYKDNVDEDDNDDGVSDQGSSNVFTTKKEALTAMSGVRALLEKSENIGENIFSAIFLIENTLQNLKSDKMIQKSITDYFKQ